MKWINKNAEKEARQWATCKIILCSIVVGAVIIAVIEICK